MAARAWHRMWQWPARCALLLGVLTAAPFVAQAQQPPAAAPTVPEYAAGTGDAWVDRQLADINSYAVRYPEAFIDELSRYAGARPAYVEALLRNHGWKPGDVYFACFWAHVTDTSCRTLVRARSDMPEGGWKAVLSSLQPPPDNAHWRALRHAIVASYDHWDRPITLDALLKRQLGDRAQRDAAARKTNR